MNRLFSLILLMLLPFLAVSQLRFEKTSHDFGDIKADEERFIDIQVKNTGKKREYFLSFRKPNQVVCLSNGQYIDPDSSLFIRIQPNPPQKGKFNYQVEIYTSDRAEATIIQVKGNLTELATANFALQSCPDFNIRPAKSKLAAPLQLQTVDKNTKELIPSVVYVVQNGIEIMRFPTKKSAEKLKIPIGFTLFFVKSAGYEPLDTALFVGPNREWIELELIPLKKQQVIAEKTPVKDTTVIAATPDIKQQPDESKPSIDRSLTEELKVSPLPAHAYGRRSDRHGKPDKGSEIIKLDSLPPDDFSTEHFMPLNVVFVLDVSSSMQASEKMNLAKYALNQLVDLLRAEDKFGVVSFATESEVIVSAAQKMAKPEIHEKIAGLKANGSTAGIAGIKQGLQELEKQFIPDGRNILIVITDGGFEMNANGEKLLQRAREKDIRVSVIGVKSGPTDAQNLTSIATKGNGNFIPINKLVHAQQNLIREIRLSCFKGI